MKKELINDSRLTPTMERLRDGQTQLFRETDKNNRTFINKDNCDVSLTHEKKEMYAELIDGKWYWVSGCAECNGKPRDWMNYIECEEHDRCRVCRKKRSELIDVPWGGKFGWTCKSCFETEEAETRREAFRKFNEANFDQLDFMYNDEILCPHCGSKLNSENCCHDEDRECDVCKGRLSVEVHHSFQYSTSIKGKRIIE